MIRRAFCFLRSVFAVGDDIGCDDITEFYYTYENINFNANYRRYHFYSEDGSYFFYHETRERRGAYGPTTKADITSSGTAELSAEEWKSFFSRIGGGTVRKRRMTAEAGYSGPWMYIYWKRDRSVYQEYSFVSHERQRGFEAYCEGLASKEECMGSQVRERPGDKRGAETDASSRYG